MPRKDRKDLLLEAGLSLSSDLSLPQLLQQIVELAVELTRARYGALGVIGRDGRISEFLTVGITAAERQAIGALPLGEGILGVLIRDAKPLRLARIADHPRSVGFPANHPPMHSFLGAPVIARGRVFGNIYLTEKLGASEFDAEDEAALVVLASQAGVAIENADLYTEAQRRARWLDALREITTAILAGAELQVVLETIGRRAREVAGADIATVVTGRDGGGPLVVQVADGAHADELRGLDVPLEGSVSAEVMRTRKSLVLADASKESRSFQPMVSVGKMGPAIFVPLVVRGLGFGTLAVANLEAGRPFDEEQVHLVETFAHQASLALEYERARRDEQRLVLMDERERIARELHDGVIQSLFAVGMGLQATAIRVADQALGRRIEGAVGEIDRAIRDLRNYIFGLRPGILADRQLEEALRRLVQEFEEKSQVTTVVEVESDVAAELASHAPDVIQLTREALSNVGRHARAETCRVSLRRSDANALLEIDDDGVGFDSQRLPLEGQGIRNIRARVEQMGGDVQIKSAPGQGTTLTVSLPL